MADDEARVDAQLAVYAAYLAAVREEAAAVNARFGANGWLPLDLRVRDDFARGKAGVAEVVEFVARDIVSRHFFTVDRAFFPLFEPVAAAVEPRQRIEAVFATEESDDRLARRNVIAALQPGKE